MVRKNGNPFRAERDAWLRLKYRTRPGKHHTARYDGVTLCAEWAKSFDAFLAHIGPMPSDAHSVDRIDNNKGYEPGNVRWSTREVQARNRRAYGGTGYRGVYAQDGRFRARIRLNGKLETIGMFDTLEEAAAARAQAELFYWGENYGN